MMRRVRRIPAGFLAVCLLALVASRAHAQRTFDYVTDQSNYSILPNGTTTVSIFLRETLANASTTSLLVAEDSLAGEGVRVTRTTSPTAPAFITAAQSDPFFDFDSDSVAAGGAQAMLSGTHFADFDGAPIITDSNLVRRVRMGQVTIQGGLIPLQTSTFTLSDDPTNSDTFTNASPNPTVLDSLIQARTFTVTTIPEPTTAAGFLVGAGLLLVRRRHGR